MLLQQIFGRGVHLNWRPVRIWVPPQGTIVSWLKPLHRLFDDVVDVPLADIKQGVILTFGDFFAVILISNDVLARNMRRRADFNHLVHFA